MCQIDVLYGEEILNDRKTITGRGKFIDFIKKDK